MIYIIPNLIQLQNKSLQNKKNSVYYLYHYFDAGVVQWLVYGLAKARMPVRSRSLAPFEDKLRTIEVRNFFDYNVLIIYKTL